MTAIGVLASGRGSNFQALCEAARQGGLGGNLTVLISDKTDAPALDVARRFGVDAVAVAASDYPGKEAHEDAVVNILETHAIGLVCLAGYLRLLSPGFIRRFPRRILNIHPALLPAFPGLHAQRQAIAHGAKVSGVTIHFVDEGCDTGPIVLQAAVDVKETDTEQALSDRILKEEHRLYPEAVRLFCADRLQINGRRVQILPEPKP